MSILEQVEKIVEEAVKIVGINGLFNPLLLHKIVSWYAKQNAVLHSIQVGRAL